MLIATNSITEINDLKKLLSKEFDLKDLGEDRKVLGMEIHRKNGEVHLLQKRLSSLMAPQSKAEVEYMSKVPYSSAVGSIMYTMVCTWPDVAQAVIVVILIERDKQRAISLLLQEFTSTDALGWRKAGQGRAASNMDDDGNPIQNPPMAVVEEAAGADYAVAIQPPPLIGNSSFHVTNTMPHLLNTKGLFAGLPKDDPNRHLKNFLRVCSTNVHPGVSIELVKLLFFLYSLTKEATAWLDNLLSGSITTWEELTELFLKKFFPPFGILQLRDEINNFRQLPNEALHETWIHFKKKVKSCPKHGLPDSVLLQTFYRSLDSVNKSVANNIAEGSIMDNSYATVCKLLDKLTETNEAWHTRELEVGGGSSSKNVLTREMIKKEEERDESMAKLITQMDLLTKHVMGGGSKAVNAVGSCEGGSPDEHNSKCMMRRQIISTIKLRVPGQTTKVLIKDLGGKVKGNKVGTRIKVTQGGEIIAKTTKGGYNNNYNNHRSSNPYVPPKGNQQNSSQPPTNDPASSKIEDMLSRVLKKVEPTDTFYRETRDKNDGDHKYNAITTRSGKPIGEEALVKDDEKMFEESIVVEEEVTPKKKRAGIEKTIIVEDGPEIVEAPKGKEAVEEMPRASPPVPRPPSPFPQRLAKKANDGKFLKFIERLKGISINIPLVEALEQMPGYAKFMKDLVTNMRHASFETMGVTHHCSSIVTKALIQKKEDPGAFTIPCTIGMYKFGKALCDLGASINLMPLAIFNKLGLRTPRPTTMRLLMANRTMKRLVGILYDVLVRVDRFIFPADFVILDCEVDFEVPIILGRPFVATGRAFVDVERNDLKFRMNDEEVTFHIFKSMKQLTDMSVVSVINTIDEAMDTTVEYEHMGDMFGGGDNEL
ncbi:uncharacterized protein LOC132057955 [Lycium ferocissimum]|uniref:uncharacterized protein LOC132057955 n=1 Tax=Lycium ferocissimum TaxID=112874 RepID=UPI0028152A78|nr:uncharacterized protein LOC132057955 [Lycium ferocissimum]